jgi:hypothetical protein
MQRGSLSGFALSAFQGNCMLPLFVEHFVRVVSACVRAFDILWLLCWQQQQQLPSPCGYLHQSTSCFECCGGFLTAAIDFCCWFRSCIRCSFTGTTAAAAAAVVVLAALKNEVLYGVYVDWLQVVWLMPMLYYGVPHLCYIHSAVPNLRCVVAQFTI